MLTHNIEEMRFDCREENGEAFIDYRVENGQYNLHHSEVPSASRGKGIGKRMIEATFEHLLSKGIVAFATCPFIMHVASKDERWKIFLK